MDEVTKKTPSKAQHGTSVLGLSFDGGRLDGVVLRRPNGSIEVRKSFSASLSLDPLTNDPELVGREIRKHLDDAGIRERRCAVCLPLKWALTLQVKLPELPEEDIESFLQVEAERGFPHAPETLMLAESRFRTLAGEKHATLVAVPRDHISRLEAVLKAARLKPVTLSLGMTAMQSAEAKSSSDVLALAPGENSIGLLVTCGGGVAVLRTLEGAFETEGSEKRVQADQVAREIRITLGQLPPEMRDAVRRVRILGRNEVADELAEQLRGRVEPLGIRVEQVREYTAEDFGVRIPAGVGVSPAISLGARYLTGKVSFEFLPPKVSAWKQYTSRYGSGKLVMTGVGAGAVVLIIVLAFLVQQFVIWHWKGKWDAISKQVGDLNTMQTMISKYRPWFDNSMRNMTILKVITESFPTDGSVSAKNVDIAEKVEDRRPVIVITCNGTAQDLPSFNQVFDKLRKTKQVQDMHQENTRGGGSTVEFTFNFKWAKAGTP